ncbi:MAG TPA: filamentous hemagglutinin N-terminal domain-containing protein, partial [Waterburya sp.]
MYQKKSRRAASEWHRVKQKGIAITVISTANAIAIIIGWGKAAVAQSQIIPDDTLGTERSQVIPNFNGLPVEVINGGAIRGANLFHSFGEFNVAPGRGAYFFSPNTAIQNILARVTGSNPSQILGTLGTFGNSNPNLFLMNPNGIIFGSGASLDVGGSFVATTANAVRLGETGQFSASEPASSSLLSVQPSAFFFNPLSPQAITNRSTATRTVLGSRTNGLQVRNGRSFILLGGDVSLNGGVLLAPGGRVELGGVAGTGNVGLSVDGNNLRLSFPDSLPRADVSLTNLADVNTRAGGGGSIAINARNLNLAGASRVRTGIASGLGSVDSKAGDIEINATDAITLTDGSFVSNAVFGRAVGKGGNINVTAGSLNLSNNAFVVTSTAGRGDAGSLTIQVRDAVSVKKSSFLSSSTLGRGNSGNLTITAQGKVSFDGEGRMGSEITGAFSDSEGIGKGGDITITAESVSLKNGAQLSVTNYERGNAGNVTINARNTVSIDGTDSKGRSSGIFSDVAREAEGTGGNINITTGSLFVTNGAVLSASTEGRGSAGSVTINAADTVLFSGADAWGDVSTIFSTVEEEAEGRGGSIDITTGSLYVTDGAQLQTLTRGRGNAGTMTINARDNVLFDGVSSSEFPSGAASSVQPGAVGEGGDINITTRSLSVTNGALLSASTFGQGNAGNILINAADAVTLSGIGFTGESSGLFTTTGTQASGQGGGILVDTAAFRIQDGAVINAQTFNSSNGGNLTVNANIFEAVNGGQMLTTTYSSGRAGNITLNVTDSVTLSGLYPNYANRITLGRGIASSEGAVSGLFANTSESSTGKGGNLSITTGQLVIQDGAQLTASSRGTGDAGNILNITARSLTLDNGFISTTSLSGQGGNIERLEVRDLLLMRNGSRISTSAGTNQSGGGDGGNITIYNDSGFIVAIPSENSDITANAFQGRGGNINITTNGIYGLEYRPQLT